MYCMYACVYMYIYIQYMPTRSRTPMHAAQGRARPPQGRPAVPPPPLPVASPQPRRRWQAGSPSRKRALWPPARPCFSSRPRLARQSQSPSLLTSQRSRCVRMVMLSYNMLAYLLCYTFLWKLAQLCLLTLLYLLRGCPGETSANGAQGGCGRQADARQGLKVREHV